MEEVGRMLEIQMPRTLIAVNGSEHVGVMAKELGAKKILILTDVGVMGAGLIDRVKGSLQKEKLTFDIFSGCLASAPLASVRECGKLIEGGQFDLMIAVGGGSVMDTAKVAAIVAAHGGDVSVLFDPGKIRSGGIRKIFLPTTSGTGSEWSNGAIFTDEASQRKAPVRSNYLLPDAVIIDPALTLNLPPSATADTGIDALCHAIEGYTSWKANIITDMVAEKVIKLVSDNLRIAYAKGSKHMEARYNMAIAAAFSMFTLRTSGSYIVHSLSYPLGIKAHLSHGTACALMLPYVMEFNLIGNMEKFAKVAELMGENTEGLSVREKAQKSIGAVRCLSADLGLPQRLGEVGLKETDIPEIVDYVFKFHAYQIENNPRYVSREDMAKILKAAL